MIIKNLRVQNFRIHGDKAIDLSPGVTIITGENGSGKTSLAEAVYIALRGSSFKGSDEDALKRGADWFRIDIASDVESNRTVKYQPSLVSKKKQFDIENKKIYRLMPKYKFPVVLFEPDDLRLLAGSPARRRKFIDTLIGLIEPNYSTILRKYERALQQRNAALKNEAFQGDLFAWNVALAEYGEIIIDRRQFYLDWLNGHVEGIYRSFGPADAIEITYSHPARQDGQKQLLAHLTTSEPRDRIVGFTTVGPHRHDVEFTFNKQLAAKTASRGETRSLILALKFAEVELINRATNLSPLIILDDVYSELDTTRQKLLTHFFSSRQTIITSTNSVADVDGLVYEL